LGAAEQRSLDSNVVVWRNTPAGLAVVHHDHLTRSAIRVSNHSWCPGLGDGKVDLLVPVPMILLAVAAGIADHPGVVSSEIPKAVAVEELALAGDDHSMAGSHCHYPEQVDYPANDYEQTNRRSGYLNGRPPGPGT